MPTAIPLLALVLGTSILRLKGALCTLFRELGCRQATGSWAGHWPNSPEPGTKVSGDELFTGAVLSAELIPFLPAGGLTKLSLQVMQENAAEFI